MLQHVALFTFLIGAAADLVSNDESAPDTWTAEAGLRQQAASVAAHEKAAWHEDLQKFTHHLSAEQPTEWLPPMENMSDPASWRDALMNGYARAYERLAHVVDELPEGPDSAQGLRNITQLRRWKARQEAAIEAFVPDEFRGAAKLDLSKRFDWLKTAMEAAAAAPTVIGAMAGNAGSEVSYIDLLAAKNLPPVANTSDPKAWKKAFMEEYAMSYMSMVDKEETLAQKYKAAPRRIEDCHTASELRAWHQAQEARIEAFVPRVWRAAAEAEAARKFREREAELQKAARQDGEQQQQPHPAALRSLPQEAPSDQTAAKPGNSTEAARRDGVQRQQPHPAALRGVPKEAPSDQTAEEAGNSTEVDKSSSQPTSLASLSFPAKIHVLAFTWLLTLVSVGLFFVSCRWQRKPAGDMGSYLLIAEA